MLIWLLSQLLELRRYGKNNILNLTVLVSWLCDKHGRDSNFWKVQPLRDHGHLLAKVSINIIFCSISLFGLFLQGLVQFSSAGSHFLLIRLHQHEKYLWGQLLGLRKVLNWPLALFTLGGLGSVPASGIWQLGSIAQLQLWSVAVGSWLQI